MTATLERFFGLAEHGTDVRTEVTAGATTFLTMAYIAFVNPQILSDAGMPFDAVFVATCLAAAFSTLVMGLYANYPIALAPGMGLNAFFAYGVVLGMGHSWEIALGTVFVSGVLFLVLSVLPVRRWIIEAIPQGLKLAIAAGIGLFLGIIALRNAGIIQASEATLVTVGELTAPGPILSLLGFCAIAALAARRVPGAALIGMLGVAVAGLALGVSEWQGIASLPPDPTPTLLALDIAGALQAGMIAIILTFLIVDLFDTTGTLIGVAHQARLLDDRGQLPRMQQALIADSTGTVGGALLGTSPVTSYIESAAGASAGGTDRPDRGRRVGAVPRLPVLRAAGRLGPALRHGGGHPLRGLSHGASAGGRELERRHRVRGRDHDGHRHPADVLHRRRHRTGLPDLRADQGDGGPVAGMLADADRGGAAVRDQVRLAVEAAPAAAGTGPRQRAVGMRPVPAPRPGGRDHLVERPVARRPAEHFARPVGARHQPRRIPGPPRSRDRGNRVSR